MFLQSHRKHVPQYTWTDHFLDASGYGIMSREDRSQWYDGVRFGRNVRSFYVECTLIKVSRPVKVLIPQDDETFTCPTGYVLWRELHK